jgi:hypothetical protein
MVVLVLHLLLTGQSQHIQAVVAAVLNQILLVKVAQAVLVVAVMAVMVLVEALPLEQPIQAVEEVLVVAHLHKRVRLAVAVS